MAEEPEREGRVAPPISGRSLPEGSRSRTPGRFRALDAAWLASTVDRAVSMVEGRFGRWTNRPRRQDIA
jgi:hypothetical protein